MLKYMGDAMSEKRQKQEKWVFRLFEVIAIIATFTCFIAVDRGSKRMLFVLPLGFALISCIFSRNFVCMTDNTAKTVITSLFFVRMVILPFLYSQKSDMQLFYGKHVVELYFTQACLLMVYEYFVVQAVIAICEQKLSNYKIKLKKVISNVDVSKMLVILLAVYVFVIALFLPQYGNQFKTIFSLSDENFTTLNTDVEYTIGSVGRMLNTLFSMAVLLFRVLFPAFLMNKMNKRNSESKMCGVILIVSCILQFMFLTSTFAEAIVSCMAVILFYIKLYPQRRKKTFLFLFISTVGMLMVYFLTRYIANNTSTMYSKNDGFLAYVAQIINAYFTGVDNVAVMFNVPSGHEVEALKAGFIGAIPFNSTLFGNKGNKLQYFFNYYNSSYGQIPPTIGAGYYYFGKALSPIFTGLFVAISLWYYKKSEVMEASLRYVAVVFCSIVFALGTVMYSPSITLSWYFSWGVPMLILTMFTGKSKEDGI